jgi:hypothetical protein
LPDEHQLCNQTVEVCALALTYLPAQAGHPVDYYLLPTQENAKRQGNKETEKMEATKKVLSCVVRNYEGLSTQPQEHL